MTVRSSQRWCGRAAILPLDRRKPASRKRPHSRRPRLATQGIGSARSLRLKTSSQKTSSHIATQRSLRNSCPFGDRLAEPRDRSVSYCWRLRPLPEPPRRGGRASHRRCAMAALLIGYARCSTDQQDLTAQHDGLTALGVSPARNLRRSRPDRQHPRSARPAGGDGGLPRRRHPGGDQARPPRPVAARRAGDRRRTHRPAGPSESRRLGLRPERPGRPAAVQRVGHGRGVRVRPDSAAHPRRE